jgi:ATP-dependent DNA helicase RecG
LEKLKTVINSSPAPGPVHPPDQQTIERISDLKEALAKLTLPVQYLKGVGPKMAARFAAKKIATVEDLLYFLPRTYEDRREDQEDQSIGSW